MQAAIENNDIVEFKRLFSPALARGLSNMDLLLYMKVILTTTPPMTRNRKQMIYHIMDHVSDNALLLNNVDIKGNLLIMYCHSPDTIDMLLRLGADINATDAMGSTPLMQSTDDAPLVSYLLEHGADVNQRDDDGDSAIFYVSDDLEVARVLIEAGADLGPNPITGNTPIMVTAGFASMNVTRYLLDNGCPGEHVNKDGDTCFTMLCSTYNTGTWDVLPAFVEYVNPNVEHTNTNGSTGLMRAADTGHHMTIRFLVNHCRVNVNRFDPSGRTALDRATFNSNNINNAIALTEVGGLFNPELYYGYKTTPMGKYLSMYYPIHYLDALTAQLGLELVQILNDEHCEKIDLEYGRDLPLIDVFNLPHDRVLDGVSHFIQRCNEAKFYDIPSLSIPLKLQRMCKCIALAAHNSKQANQDALDYARLNESRTTKKRML